MFPYPASTSSGLMMFPYPASTSRSLLVVSYPASTPRSLLVFPYSASTSAGLMPLLPLLPYHRPFARAHHLLGLEGFELAVRRHHLIKSIRRAVSWSIFRT